MEQLGSGWIEVEKLRSRWQVSVPHSTPFRKEVRVQVGRRDSLLF